MVNIDLHRSMFINILRDIYGNPSLRTVLGFKGGTAAMLFYGLPRFSVDLDFDLLEEDKKEVVFEKISLLIPRYGMLSQASEKKSPCFSSSITKKAREI